VRAPRGQWQLEIDLFSFSLVFYKTSLNSRSKSVTSRDIVVWSLMKILEKRHAGNYIG